MTTYKIVDGDVVELTDGDYIGCRFRFGKVELIPEHDQLRLKFEYFPVDNQPRDVNFEQTIGQVLHQMIEEGLFRNDIVYTGGVDAS